MEEKRVVVEIITQLLHDNTLYTNLAQKQDVGQGLRHKSPSTSETSGLPNLIFEDVECK